MLRAVDDALCLHTLGLVGANDVAEVAVLRVILPVTAADRCAVDVAAAVPDFGQTAEGSLNAHDATAGFKQFLVPCACGDGLGDPLDAVGTLRNQLTETAVVIGAACGGHGNALNRVGAAGVHQEAGHLVNRQLVDEFIPCVLVLPRNQTHIREGQTIVGPLREVTDFGCIGGLFVPVKIQIFQQRIIHGQGHALYRVGILPVGTGQVGHFDAVVVQIGVVKLVGDLHRVIHAGHFIGSGVQLGLIPAVYLGGVAVRSHTVRGGVALGCQNVVQCIVGVVTDRQIVVTGAEDVPCRALAVIAGQEVALYGHGDGCFLTRLQHGGLFKADQLDGCLLDLIFLLIAAVRSLCVHLNNTLTGNRTSVLYADADLIHIRVGIKRDALERLVKGRVAQTIAERIDNLIAVRPGIADRSARGAVRIAGTHNGVLIAGFVVLVADVDALGIDGVVENVGAVAIVIGRVGK